MKRSSILKICTAVLAAAALLTPVSVKAETPEEARINAELQAAKLSQERTYLTDIYRAKEEEFRVAKEYLAAAESLAKINPLFESEITPAKERVEKAEKAVERANAFLQILPCEERGGPYSGCGNTGSDPESSREEAVV